MGAENEESGSVVVKIIVRKQMKTENREKEEMRRFNGSLESRTVRGRERESERVRTQETQFKNSNSIHFLIYMCVFIHANLYVYTPLFIG